LRGVAFQRGNGFLRQLFLKDKLGDAGSSTLEQTSTSRNPDIEAMRSRIRTELLATNGNGLKVTTFPSATMPKV
jgi:hypothetical protein